jgi:hypothetical protein
VACFATFDDPSVKYEVYCAIREVIPASIISRSESQCMVSEIAIMTDTPSSNLSPSSAKTSPGGESIYTWPSFFKALRGQLSPTEQAQYFAERDIIHEEADCKRCDKWKEALFRTSQSNSLLHRLIPPKLTLPPQAQLFVSCVNRCKPSPPPPTSTPTMSAADAVPQMAAPQEAFTLNLAFESVPTRFETRAILRIRSHTRWCTLTIIYGGRSIGMDWI